MNIYVVVESPEIGDCFIEYNVVYKELEGINSRFVCSCVRKKDAEMICKALNQGENK